MEKHLPCGPSPVSSCVCVWGLFAGMSKLLERTSSSRLRSFSVGLNVFLSSDGGKQMRRDALGVERKGGEGIQVHLRVSEAKNVMILLT